MSVPDILPLLPLRDIRVDPMPGLRETSDTMVSFVEAFVSPAALDRGMVAVPGAKAPAARGIIWFGPDHSMHARGYRHEM